MPIKKSSTSNNQSLAKKSKVLLHFKILSIILGILVVLLSYTCWKFMQNPKPQVELFFTQTAAKSQISLEGNGSNVYHLTLEDIPDKVSFISNSPFRDFGTVQMTTFADLWKKEFAQDHPNASLVGYDQSKISVSYKLEIVDARYDQASKKVIYTVRLLSSNPPAESLSDTTLFIDSINLDFINQSNSTNSSDIVIFQKNQ